MVNMPAYLPSWQFGISASVTSSILFVDDQALYESARVGHQEVLRFPAALRLTNTELAVFERFIYAHVHSGCAWFFGPYVDSSGSENTGVMRLVNGDYDITYVAENFWEVNTQVEVWKNASFT